MIPKSKDHCSVWQCFCGMVTWIQTKWFNFEFYGLLDICFFTDIHTGWSQLQKFMVKVWTWIFKTINDFVNWNPDCISNSLTDINCTFLEYKTLKWILQGHIFYTQAHRIILVSLWRMWWGSLQIFWWVWTKWILTRSRASDQQRSTRWKQICP